MGERNHVMVKSNLVRLGGGILLLLPLCLYSHNNKGLSLSYTASDNLYLLNIKESGSIISISPFIQYQSYFDFNFDGTVSLINLSTTNLFLENNFELQKVLYLPGVGNKNSTYLRLYSFLATSYKIYRFVNLSIGDSINVYILNNYLFSSGIGVTYRLFLSDSLSDYLETEARSSISIPLPYFFFIPEVTGGLKMYENETLPFYKFSPKLNFPLLLNFSFGVSFVYSYFTPPKGDLLLSSIYTDDPFFEEEVVEQMLGVKIYSKKLFLQNYSQLNIGLQAFEKKFFEVDNQERKDKGLIANVTLKKFININSSFSIHLESLLNSSTIKDFEYTKNSIELRFELIF